MPRRFARSILLLLLCMIVTGHLWAHESVSIAAVQIEDEEHGSDHDHPTTPQARLAPFCHLFATPEATVTLEIPVKSRNVRDEIAFGALRIDDDVGLYRLLLTYLI